MKALFSILILVLGAAGGRAQPLAEKQIRVTATLARTEAQLVSDIRMTGAPDGARLIEIRLTNRTNRDVELIGAEVEFPWVAPAGTNFRIAAGATATGRWAPTLVFDPAKDGGEPVSGMYLLAQCQGRYSLAAFTSWKTFWSKLHYRDGRLVMTADGEGRRIRSGETVSLEKIRLSEGVDWQDLLYGYADAIARALHLPPKPPRHWVGWSPWDYYARGFRTADVRGNVEALQKLLPNANLVQIDGGWWRERGDFDGAREDLGPEAMKSFAADFRKRGLVAGIHLDGMRVSERSTVARQHPEFFLHDESGRLVRETRGAGGDGPYVFFDYSHPGACDYMRDSLRRLRRDWGYDYFKIDYLRAGIAEDVIVNVFKDDHKRKIVPHDRGLTSVERFHRAMTAFREGMGNDAWFLGCSTPFGPTFGYVDALRTGPDIAAKFTGFQNQTEANAGNFYLHGKVVQVDSDYLVVRAKEDQDATMVKDDGGKLTLNEAEMWTAYVALCSGPKIASDNLMSLRDERKDLVRFAATRPPLTRFVPLDFWQHARARADAFQVFLCEAGREVYLLLLNWDEATRSYTAQGLPVEALPEKAIVHGNAEIVRGEAGVQITLAPRHTAILRLSEIDFDRARKTIRIE